MYADMLGGNLVATLTGCGAMPLWPRTPDLGAHSRVRLSVPVSIAPDSYAQRMVDRVRPRRGGGMVPYDVMTHGLQLRRACECLWHVSWELRAITLAALRSCDC